MRTREEIYLHYVQRSRGGNRNWDLLGLEKGFFEKGFSFFCSFFVKEIGFEKQGILEKTLI